jgi:hypothetical protein
MECHSRRRHGTWSNQGKGELGRITTQTFLMVVKCIQFVQTLTEQIEKKLPVFV